MHSTLFLPDPHRSSALSRLTLRTLGHLSLAIGGKQLPLPSTQKARAILVFIAMYGGSDVPRERLMETFWPEAEPERARDSLNTALHAVRLCFRKADLIPDAFVVATRSVVRWIAETDFDVERLVSAKVTMDRGTLRTVIDNYSGEFLPGCYEEWVVEQRERLSLVYERLLLAAVCDFADRDAAHCLLELNPFEEASYLLLLDSEQVSSSFEAARLARRCRAVFAESGIRPSPQLLDLLDTVPVLVDSPRRLPESAAIVARTRSPLTRVLDRLQRGSRALGVADDPSLPVREVAYRAGNVASASDDEAHEVGSPRGRQRGKSLMSSHSTSLSG